MGVDSIADMADCCLVGIANADDEFDLVVPDGTIAQCDLVLCRIEKSDYPIEFISICKVKTPAFRRVDFICSPHAV